MVLATDALHLGWVCACSEQRAPKNGHNGLNGDSAGAASAQVGGTPKTRMVEHEPKWVERRTSAVERRAKEGGTADRSGWNGGPAGWRRAHKKLGM